MSPPLRDDELSSGFAAHPGVAPVETPGHHTAGWVPAGNWFGPSRFGGRVRRVRNANGRQRGLDALTTLERLHPGAVAAGHKREQDSDHPDLIDDTRRYIEDFSAAFDKATYTELYETMVTLHPNRLNRGVLWNSVKSVFA
jgi:hypothetical protein